jgi:diaminopimelate decarboxylase
MENDRLFILEDALELKENDSIIYEKVGAYTMCLTPLFIEYFPDVYLEDNGELTNIRERWTSKKLL